MRGARSSSRRRHDDHGDGSAQKFSSVTTSKLDSARSLRPSSSASRLIATATNGRWSSTRPNSSDRTEPTPATQRRFTSFRGPLTARGARGPFADCTHRSPRGSDVELALLAEHRHCRRSATDPTATRLLALVLPYCTIRIAASTASRISGSGSWSESENASANTANVNFGTMSE